MGVDTNRFAAFDLPIIRKVWMERDFFVVLLRLAVVVHGVVAVVVLLLFLFLLLLLLDFCRVRVTHRGQNSRNDGRILLASYDAFSGLERSLGLFGGLFDEWV